MKGWLIIIPVVIITTFLKSAARKANVKINQQFLTLSQFILHLPFLLKEFNRNFFLCLETIAVRMEIISTAIICSVVYPAILSVLSRHFSVMRDSCNTQDRNVSVLSGDIWNVPAFRRTFIDAMSRVLRYAGLSE